MLIMQANPGFEKKNHTGFAETETFGPPDVHWIRATADPRDPMVFQFEQRIVEANIRKR